MDNNEKIIITQARNFGDNIGDTFALIKHAFKPLGKACLYVTGPLVLLFSIILGLVQSEFVGGMFGSMNPVNIQKNTDAMNMFTKSAFLIVVGYVLIMVLSLIIVSLLQAFTYEYMVLYQQKDYETITHHDVIAGGKKYGFKLVLTNLGVGILFFLIFFIVIMGATIGAEVSSVGKTMMTALIPLAMFFFLILGMYFAIMFILTPVVRVFELKGFWKSLGRSLKLMFGNFWNTFGLLFILMIIISFMGTIFMIPYFGVIGFMTFHALDKQAANLPYLKPLLVFTTSLNGLSTFLYIIPFFSIGLKYYTLIEKKEGVGIMERVDELIEDNNTTDAE